MKEEDSPPISSSLSPAEPLLKTRLAQQFEQLISNNTQLTIDQAFYLEVTKLYL